MLVKIVPIKSNHGVIKGMYPFIVADVGGTNARFALVRDKKGAKYQIDDVRAYLGRNYNTFEEVLTEYLLSIDARPKGACIAIAAPIEGDRVSMANLPWSFSKFDIAKQFQFNAFEVINDFTSVALATSCLEREDLNEVVAGVRKPQGNKLAIGAGTGLGVGALMSTGQNKWLSILTEGGHVTLGPANHLEAEVITAAYCHHDYVSAETFLSGPGLVNLYHALADVKGEKVEEFSPADITNLALSSEHGICVETLQLFCSFLGTVSSNFVLSYGITGGVYLSGGIIPRFLPFLKSSEFTQRFRYKGAMTPLLENVSVDYINNSQVAYLGAAIHYEQVNGTQ